MIFYWTSLNRSFLYMKKIQPHVSPSASGEHSPFKDLLNTPIESNANTTSVQPDKKLSWYARLSDEKKAEYLQRRRIDRQQTKAAKLNSLNSKHVSQSHDSSLPSVQCTPLSTVMNTHNNGTIIPFRSCYVYLSPIPNLCVHDFLLYARWN
jgi:hypothetical protein